MPATIDTPAAHVAAFLDGFSLDDAPPEVVALTNVAFVDTIGVMLAGSREPGSRIVCDTAAAEGAAPLAGIVGRALRTSPANAALANGMATQALDYDLTYMIGQSAAALIAGLLPLAESLGSTPRDIAAAWIAGCEVVARIARSYPQLSSNGGWHGAGVVGAMASAAAFAKLAKAPAETIPAIIGIAASTASGIGVNFGTMTKPLHAGLAARSGLLAVELGRRGFTASPQAIDGPGGFLQVFGRGLATDPAPFADLGRTFNLIDPGYRLKPYACGGLLHSGIEAALDLKERLGARIDAIERIEIGVGPHAAARAIGDYPTTEDSARFSLAYLAAYALLEGAPMRRAFTEEGYGDARIKALAEKVVAGIDPEFAKITGSGYSPSRLRVHLRGGEILESLCDESPGSRKKPLGEARIREKFLSCAEPVIGDAAADLYGYLQGFAGQTTCGDLWSLLYPTDTV
jgi:2-methylcitrate dehydratase PrpD